MKSLVHELVALLILLVSILGHLYILLDVARSNSPSLFSFVSSFGTLNSSLLLLIRFYSCQAHVQ
jgi:hypothetical protein